MSLQMIFNENELYMTRGLADAFIEILTSRYNYTYSEEFKNKAYKFIVHLTWEHKKKLRGAELTEKQFDKFVDAIFYMLLTSKTFLNEFDNFNINYTDDETIIKPVGQINQNTSKYLS